MAPTSSRVATLVPLWRRTPRNRSPRWAGVILTAHAGALVTGADMPGKRSAAFRREGSDQERHPCNADERPTYFSRPWILTPQKQAASCSAARRSIIRLGGRRFYWRHHDPILAPLHDSMNQWNRHFVFHEILPDLDVQFGGRKSLKSVSGFGPWTNDGPAPDRRVPCNISSGPARASRPPHACGHPTGQHIGEPIHPELADHPKRPIPRNFSNVRARRRRRPPPPGSYLFQQPLPFRASGLGDRDHPRAA